MTKVPLLLDTMDVRPRETVQWQQTALKQQQQNQQQGNDMLGMPQHFHYQYTTSHVKDEETQSHYHQQIS